MPQKGTGWVSGKLPAKLSQIRQPIGDGPQTLKRIQRLQQLQAMGKPLADYLRQRPVPADGKWSYFTAGVLVIAVSFAVIGTIAGRALWLFAAFGMGLLAALLFIVSRRQLGDHMHEKLTIDAEKLDRVLEAYAANLPQDAVALLIKMKRSLGIAISSTLSLDDTLFTREMVARYIPDACKHYCDLKAIANHGVRTESDRSAEDSLLSQLQILDDRLTDILGTIIADKRNTLVHHEIFLRTKQ